MRYITEEEIIQNLSMPDVIGLMETVFEHPERGDMPPKIYLEKGLDGNDFRAMPARFGDFAGIKWAAIFPENGKNGHGPSVSATIILNSLESGHPLAIMDGMLITSYRTAAVTGLATKYLSKPSSHIASFIGCGFQTKFQLQAVTDVRNIGAVRLFDLDRDKSQSLKEELDKDSHSYSVSICDSVRECMWGSDIITTLTPSRNAFIMSGWLEPGMHINSVGADAVGKQEFENNIANFCSKFVVDDKVQAFHSGEAQHSENNSWMVDLFHIVQSKTSRGVNGAAGARLEAENKGITFFDSTGLAIEDIALAGQIYQKLDQQGG